MLGPAVFIYHGTSITSVEISSQNYRYDDEAEHC